MAFRGQELSNPVGDPCKQLRAGTLLEGIGDGPLFVDDIKVTASRERCPAHAKVSSTLKKILPLGALVSGNVHLDREGFKRRLNKREREITSCSGSLLTKIKREDDPLLLSSWQFIDERGNHWLFPSSTE